MVRAVRSTLLAALAVGACGALPGAARGAPDYAPAAGAEPAAETSPLAPALRELAKPAVRALPERAQARRLGIAAEGPGSLIRSDDRILVNARFEAGALARLPALRRLGGEVRSASRRYQEVTLSVPYGKLDELAEVGGIGSVTPAVRPVLRTTSECRGGIVISEGVEQLRVDQLRTALEEAGISEEGKGLTVGVLSDSFDQAEEAVSGGPIAAKAVDDERHKELPGDANPPCEDQEDRVRVLRSYIFGEGDPPPSDEGRAMLQIVHDIVPKAKLAFYSAFNGEADFAAGIEKLAEPPPEGAGADVIVDDVAYFEEPFFQDGPVAAAIDRVVLGQGVTYLTAAGNDNIFDAAGREISSWETPDFTDSGDCPPEVRARGGDRCLDFNGGPEVDRTFGIKVRPGGTLTVDLQWAEPWYRVGTDLDAYLLDAEGRLLTMKRERNVTSTKKPVEWLQWTNESGAEATVQLVVDRFSGGTPVTKFILLETGSSAVSGTEYPRSGGGNVVGPSIFGHAGALAAITVGAVPYPGSLFKGVEPYSSRGPVSHYYFPVDDTTPSAPIPGAPNVISKPDVVATDCGRTTFFAIRTMPAIWRFCGTSAAAPHAAGIAALALEGAGGSASPFAVRNALAGTGEAVAKPPAGTYGSCAAGGGMLNAVAAVGAIRGEVKAQPPAPCEPPAAGVPGEAVERAAGFWGRESPLNPPPEPPLTPPPTPGPPPVVPPAPIPEPTPAPSSAPATRITAHPKRVVRTRRARVRVRFRFAADQAGVRFLCQFDGSAYHACAARVDRWFGLGPHVVKVKARADELLDRSPAVFRFKVVRDRSARRSSHRRRAR